MRNFNKPALFFTLFCLTIEIVLSNSLQTQVILVQMVFRTGVRSVHSTYPTDKLPLSYWDKYGGVEQLTSVGMKQMQKFGNHFRNLYQFLNRTYDRKRVLVRSCDKDRLIQSSYVFLTGLFGPSSDQRWTKVANLTGYMPIPVHTNDEYIFNSEPCEKYENLRTEARNSPEWLKIEQNYKEAHGIKLPKWIIDNYHTIMHLRDKTYFVDFSSIQMAKLISGGLLNDILRNIKSKIEGSASELFIYGADEEYLVGLQKLLTNFPSTNLVSPNFGSAYMFELRIDKNGNYYVHILFKNNNYPAPFKVIPVNINGCDMICPLNDFFRLTNGKILEDFDSECSAQAL